MSLDASSQVTLGASRHVWWVLSAVSWPDAERGRPHPSTPHSLVSRRAHVGSQPGGSEQTPWGKAADPQRLR